LTIFFVNALEDPSIWPATEVRGLEVGEPDALCEGEAAAAADVAVSSGPYTSPSASWTGRKERRWWGV